MSDRLTPDQQSTMEIQTLTLNKVKRRAVQMVSPALLDQASVEIVSDYLSDGFLRAMFSTEVLGKPEVSDWWENREYVLAPGIWNGLKAVLAQQWPFTLDWFKDRDIPFVSTVSIHKKHTHTTYHMCPHVNEWVDSKQLPLRWLTSVPVPPRED